jgi:hypothetical protein
MWYVVVLTRKINNIAPEERTLHEKHSVRVFTTSQLLYSLAVSIEYLLYIIKNRKYSASDPVTQFTDRLRQTLYLPLASCYLLSWLIFRPLMWRQQFSFQKYLWTCMGPHNIPEDITRCYCSCFIFPIVRCSKERIVSATQSISIVRTLQYQPEHIIDYFEVRYV